MKVSPGRRANNGREQARLFAGHSFLVDALTMPRQHPGNPQDRHAPLTEIKRKPGEFGVLKYRNFVSGWVLLMGTPNTMRALGLLGFLLPAYAAPTLAAEQTLYGANLCNDELVSIDPATGAATMPGGFGAEGLNVSSLAA